MSVLGKIDEQVRPRQPDRHLRRHRWQRGPWSYLVAIAVVMATTGLIYLFHANATLVNIPPIYLLAVQAIAVLIGSRAAVVASFGAFLAFDWFFVDPKYQFTVRDPFEFVALCVFLVSAILVGQLTALFRGRAEEALQRELAATALARASWTVASQVDPAMAIGRVLQELVSVSVVENAILVVANDQQQYAHVASYVRTDAEVNLQPDSEALSFVASTKQRIGWDHSSHWQKALATTADRCDVYLPVISDGELFGILYLRCTSGGELSDVDRQVIASLINHIAVVLQRSALLEAQTKSQALVETNRLKTALLQMVSHDFRSPLASIKASVSSLLSEEGGPIDAQTQRGLMQAIEQETDRLNRMVGNLLDLSRLEADAWRPQREECSLSELVGSALDSFNAQDNKRINLAMPPSTVDLSVDPVQMIQVFRNLLENALKYTNGRVDFAAHKEGSSVIIEVKDEGPGLPSGEEETVFEPFYRAEEHQESSLPGMGMGLAVCRGLVEAHGGTLTASNRTTRGAVFRINLPNEKGHSG